MATLFACKNDVKSDAVDTKAEDSVIYKVSQETIDRSNNEKSRGSVMTRIMMTEELQKLASAIISGQLNDKLANDDGPFTVFGPSSDAFGALTEAQRNTLQNNKNVSFLKTTLQGHIIEGNHTSADMVQQLRDVDTLQYTSLNAQVLKIYKSGTELFVMDSKGNKAQIGKSDLQGNNGSVHVIDAFLGLD